MKTLVTIKGPVHLTRALLWFMTITFGLVFLAGIIAIAFNIRQNDPAFYMVYALGLSSPFLGALVFHLKASNSIRPLKVMFFSIQFWPGIIMIVIVPFVSVIAFWFASFFGLSVHWESLPSPLTLLTFVIGWTSIIWLEETAWRGTLLPVLQDKFSPFVSSVLVNVVWVIWHIPLLYLIEMNLLEMGWFALQTLGMCFSMTWAYNRSKTVLIPVLIHASYNATTGWLLNAVHLVDPNDIISVQAVGQIALGIIVLLLTRSKLGFQYER